MKNEVKKMNLKMLIPILVIFMMGISLITMQHASAGKVDIKVYDMNNLPVKQIDTDYSIKKGEELNFATTLHFNEGVKQWFRYINCIITNSKGLVMYNTTKITLPGIANYHINTNDWSKGTYHINFNYEGNSTTGSYKAEKNVTLHIE